MSALYQLVLALLSSGAPWLATILVVAIAVARIGPIRLSVSIGDHGRSGKRERSRSAA